MSVQKTSLAILLLSTILIAGCATKPTEVKVTLSEFKVLAEPASARANTPIVFTITNAGTGLCHAMAYPLGSSYHVPHGMANALLLPAVLDYNLLGNLPKMARVAAAMGESVAGLSDRAAAVVGVNSVRQLCRDVGLPSGLRDAGVPESALEGFVAGTLSAQRLITNNPRVPTPEAVLQIYRESF